MLLYYANFSEEKRMEILTLTPVSFESSSHLLCEGNEAILVDAGAAPDKVDEVLAEKGLSLSAIVLTHGHFDHILSVDLLREKHGAPVLIHEADAELLGDAEKNAFSTFFGRVRTWKPADRTLREGDEIALGSTVLTVLHTPGHTRGSICLLGDGILLSGDTLFASGYGRYDLYGGDENALKASLARLASLPADIMVYPGHGGASTLENALFFSAPFFR